MRRVIYVALGRYGDIINILPVVRQASIEAGHPIKLVVSERFARLVDGCSYVEPLFYRGNFDELGQALQWASQNHGRYEVLAAQVYGEGPHWDVRTPCFLKDAWLRAGAFSHQWGSLPLVFDRRSPEREEALRSASFPAGNKPVVLTSLSGHSSPFSHREHIVKMLRDRLSGFHVLDMTDIPVHRLYDLLGLIDHAHCLITVDTATMHLSNASATPTIALTSSGPSRWYESLRMPHHVARFKYTEFPACQDRLVQAVVDARNPSRHPRIHHVVSKFDTQNLDTQRRNGFARSTWNRENSLSGGVWNLHDISDSNLPRIEDGMPCVRDLITKGFRAANDDDVIAISNSDVSFMSGITGQIFDLTQRNGAVYAHRWDFQPEKFPAAALNYESQLGPAKWYPGCDFFAFRKSWWLTHGKKFPDMILGREFWDLIMATLIKLTKGAEIHQAIYHEKHPSFWERPGVRAKNPGNRCNRALAEKFFKEHGGSWDSWKHANL